MNGMRKRGLRENEYLQNENLDENQFALYWRGLSTINQEVTFSRFFHCYNVYVFKRGCNFAKVYICNQESKKAIRHK